MRRKNKRSHIHNDLVYCTITIKLHIRHTGGKYIPTMNIHHTLTIMG